MVVTYEAFFLTMRYSRESLGPSIDRHFRLVAAHYRQLRDLDHRTIRYVANLLSKISKPTNKLRLLEVGAGTGRYAEAVIDTAAEHGVVCWGVACDARKIMVGKGPIAHGAEIQLSRVVGLAELLPFRVAAFDAVLSFNAVHHFEIDAFLLGVARVLRAGGLLIVYTRTPEQNRRTVWGRFFPGFAERETRLYGGDELRAALAQRPEFYKARLHVRPWTLRKTLSRLVDQARGHCYSTFSLYTPAELEAALEVFEQRLIAAYHDPTAITAQNDHVLIVARRGDERSRLRASDTGAPAWSERRGRVSPVRRLPV